MSDYLSDRASDRVEKAFDREVNNIENDPTLSEEEKHEQILELEAQARHDYNMEKGQLYDEYHRY